jgi:hypothetical protein
MQPDQARANERGTAVRTAAGERDLRAECPCAFRSDFWDGYWNRGNYYVRQRRSSSGAFFDRRKIRRRPCFGPSSDPGNNPKIMMIVSAVV